MMAPNKNAKNWSLNSCLHELIAEQASKSPDNIALQFGDTQLSYRQLDEQSNRCARYLHQLGIEKDEVVGLLMDRSVELVIGMLGIMKAGGAYLPLDPEHPESRRQFVLEDAEVSIVLSQNCFKEKLSNFIGTVRMMDNWQGLHTGSSEPLVSISQSEDLAYVIYTSGSTGQPKGCMLPHAAICNRLHWMQSEYPLDKNDRVLQKTPYTFDVSVWEFFWPLISGACMVLAAPGGQKDNHYLVNFIREHNISICHFVPSMLRFFLNDADVSQCKSLKNVFVSGEALPYELMQSFSAKLPRSQLHNLYGPTEAAVDVSYWTCQEREDGIVPIGKAIDHIQLHILNENLQTVSAGETGELYIAGIGLARGYLNRPELTRERFLDNPFSSKVNAKMYRTGDLARTLPDGNIEYLGRTDFQVKLRGLRVELGEIETVLRSYSGISEAAVLVKGEEDGDAKLVAYLECQQTLTSKQVREHCAQTLPDYMLPNIVRCMAQLPVTAHGKLDRKALPWPVKNNQSKAQLSEPLSTEAALLDYDDIVAKISACVASVINADGIKLDDDLFDLGATSLSLVRVVAKIKQNFNISVPVDVFLDEPTIEGITNYVVQLQKSVSSNDVNKDRADETTPQTQKLTPLPEVEFQQEFYQYSQTHRQFSQDQISLSNFSSWLGLLQKQQKHGEDNKSCYLYPSGGGFNPVRTYLSLKAGAVATLPAGSYYYDPIEHALHRVGDAVLDEEICHRFNRDSAAQAQFAVYFIVSLDAIAPIYGEVSRTLGALEAGYMAQLLQSRQADYALGVCPLVSLDFDQIKHQFDLNDSERYVYGLLGGVPKLVSNKKKSDNKQPDNKHSEKSIFQVLNEQKIGLNDHLRPCENSVQLRHDQFDSAAQRQELSQDLLDEFHYSHHQFRKFSDTANKIDLPRQDFQWDDYRLRACQRDYQSGPLTQDQLARVLALVKPNADGQSLYGGISDGTAIQVYVYLKQNAVPGLDSGVYLYDAQQHALLYKGELSSDQMESSYTPFNRKHYKKSSLCIFMLGNKKLLSEEDRGLHLSYIESGYMGQLLMERQAEFGLGICPIGAIRFDKIRSAFAFDCEHQILLQSFTCGIYEQEIPANRKCLEARKTSAFKVADKLQQPLAIVGISGIYPGAKDNHQFWENLQSGRSSVAAMSAERQRDLAMSTQKNPIDGAYLESIANFDSLLFKISPAEARTMDPQERLLLEQSWACLEDAGYTAAALNNACEHVGVFIGAMWNDYQSQGVQLWQAHHRVEEVSYHASIANRISHYFDFSGPSVAINTSCSSAMTALHIACQNLRLGEINAAIVGGVNLVSHSYHSELLKQEELLSSDSVCRPFSAEANGWVVGEGVGALLIKTLVQAQNDNDHIYGLIKGSAIAHSGNTLRFGVPDAKQQAKSIQRSLQNAGIKPHNIDYIEAAAPGASLADAVEMSAIKSVFGNDKKRDSACLVGTVKGNIGHLESASAMSQIAKVLMQFKHQCWAPSLHSQPINPLLGLDNSGIAIVEQCQSWRDQGAHKSKQVLINVVGAAGSEAHVVLQSYPQIARQPEDGVCTLVPLSAETPEQLIQQLNNLQQFIAQQPNVRLDDLAFTLREGRVVMAERLAFIVADIASLSDLLTQCLQQDLNKILEENTPLVGKNISSSNSQDEKILNLARDWLATGTVDWSRLNKPSYCRMPLPTYPFEKVRHWIGEKKEELSQRPSPSQKPTQEQPSAAQILNHGNLHQSTLEYLSRLLAKVTELPISRISKDSRFEEYGLSSLMIQRLNRELQADFGDLSSTLMFQYRSIDELTEYFIDQHQSVLCTLFEVAVSTARPMFSKPRPHKPLPTESQSRKNDTIDNSSGDIAIIGLAGRYPQSENIDEYWNKLKNAVDCIEEIPQERWDYLDYYEKEKEKEKVKSGKTPSKWGGFLSRVDHFDALFFGITPREAETIDPQERLFLETAWQVIEDAGYSRESLNKTSGHNVGVFVGVMYGEYQLFPSMPGGLAQSNCYSTIANRVSYFMDLHGPSMAVDTMCSSSLTAIQLACESIKRGECNSAIAGGVNLSLHPNKYATHAKMSMSSSDGRCKSFAAGGDGFVPSEGVGAVLLKPLNQAVADGDQIYGVIKACVLNHGGRTNGFTVPDPNAHASLIAKALDQAQLHADSISYIEAHGTGTSLGDPIEIDGLNKAFKHRSRTTKCAIGSVKSNIGHCESAAGIAGLSKILLQLKHKLLVPSLHSESVNPNIDFSASPFQLQRELSAWESSIGSDGRIEPRRAGISSFGAGGSNAHLIVEEYVACDRASTENNNKVVIITLSARNPERLLIKAEQLQQCLCSSEHKLSDLAYTLQLGREEMDARFCCVVSSCSELVTRLQQFIDKKPAGEGFFLGNTKTIKQSLGLMFSSGVGDDLVDNLIDQQKLSALAELWIMGFAIDWQRFWASGEAQRISLPSYPFDRQRYWVSEAIESDLTVGNNLSSNTNNKSGACTDSALPAGEALTFNTEFFQTLLDSLEGQQITVENALDKTVK